MSKRRFWTGLEFWAPDPPPTDPDPEPREILSPGSVPLVLPKVTELQVVVFSLAL